MLIFKSLVKGLSDMFNSLFLFSLLDIEVEDKDWVIIRVWLYFRLIDNVLNLNKERDLHDLGLM